MNASSALQLGNEQYLLGLRVEFPYDLTGISVRTRSDRTKTSSREVAEPCLSGCDSGCVSWIKFVACIARVIQHDLHVHLLLRLWMDSAKATRVVSSCSRLHPNRWLDGPGWRLSGSGRIDAWQIVCRRAKE